MILNFTSFAGANSDIAPPLLPENFAVEATNVFTDNGVLNVWRSPKEVTFGNTKEGTIKSLFLLDNSIWLAWTETVSVAPVQKANNSDWDVVITGLDVVRYTNKTLSVAGGGTSYPEVTYPLGISAPSPTLVATKANKVTPDDSFRAFWSVAGTVTDSVGDRIGRTYVWTYVNDKGQEGPPSSPSNIIYTNDDETITLTAAMSVPRADINKGRLYVAAIGGTYNYHSEFTLPQTSLTINDNSFGTAIQTTTWDGPTSTLSGLVSLANGSLAGYSGNDLYISEPFQSHAWPDDYKYSLDYPIKGIASDGNMIYISTAGNPVMATVNTPSFVTFVKLPTKQASVSTRSMVNMGYGAAYASNDGIVLMSNGGVEMITDGIISERVYQAMVPSSIHAYFYRDKYVAFYDSGSTGTITAETGETFPAKGAFILDIKRKVVTFTDVTCDAAYSDKNSGKLYMVKTVVATNKLYEFNGDTTNLPMAWTSKPIITPPVSFTIAQVIAERYPVTFQFYANGVLKQTKTIRNKEAFRINTGFTATKWAVRVSGDSIIEGVFMASSTSELL